MPHIVYSEDREPFTGRPIPYAEQDAVRYWAVHYRNWCYLSFVRSRSEDRVEVRQAEHELRLCQQKMDHWVRHVNWVAEAAARERSRVDREWER